MAGISDLVRAVDVGRPVLAPTSLEDAARLVFAVVKDRAQGIQMVAKAASRSRDMARERYNVPEDVVAAIAETIAIGALMIVLDRQRENNPPWFDKED